MWKFGELVGDCDAYYNHGLYGGRQLDNDIAESRLSNLQYKISKGEGRVSSARSPKLLEIEIPGMGK